VAYFVKALLCALCHCHPYMHSGVTGSLKQEWNNLAERGPLATTEHSEKKAKKR